MARVKVQTEPTQRQPDATAADSQTCMLEIPIGDPTFAAVPHRVEAQLWTTDARAGLARLYDALRRIGAKRRDTDRPIESHADAVRWMLEEYERAAEQVA